jgi:4-methyl-5(b-hydroxyethyl)-thiazole monophosphate biosynthesis
MFYCFLADGFEEIEAITTVDMLRRAGIDIKTVAVTEHNRLTVRGAHNILVTADMYIKDADTEDLQGVFLPGGMPGTTNLDESADVRNLIKYCADNDKYIFAICAAPSVLGHMGLLEGKKATCYPGFESELTGAVCCDEPAVQDDKIITGKGPGATVSFAKLIISELVSENAALSVCSSMQCSE